MSAARKKKALPRLSAGKAAVKAPEKVQAAAQRAFQATQASPSAPDSMSPEVIEFITAIDLYKRASQRPFPSWSEILEIVKALGYRRSA